MHKMLYEEGRKRVICTELFPFTRISPKHRAHGQSCESYFALSLITNQGISSTPAALYRIVPTFVRCDSQARGVIEVDESAA